MVDRRRIVRRWKQNAAQVLVTLVGVEGSSYRRPGAHLLVGSDGEYSGTISGGCLESEVVRKASWIVRDGAVVESYSTLFDDTADIPFGLGCGGVVRLLFEPVNTPECEALLRAMELSLGGKETLVATWLPDERGVLRRAVFNHDGEIVFSSDGLSRVDLDSLNIRSEVYGTASANIYYEALASPQRLFVLGAGDDAKPVVTLASLLGWSVTVADGRSQLAHQDRFPEAAQVSVITSTSQLSLSDRDAVVLMTHSYEQDRGLLTSLLSAARPGYIGLLGARHRSSLLIAEAAASLGLSIAECCHSICAPVGLDLGGDGPEAIALAVVAEVQAWVQGKLGSSRRLSADDVAEQLAQGGASRYLHTHCAVGAAE